MAILDSSALPTESEILHFLCSTLQKRVKSEHISRAYHEIENIVMQRVNAILDTEAKKARSPNEDMFYSEESVESMLRFFEEDWKEVVDMLPPPHDRLRFSVN